MPCTFIDSLIAGLILNAFTTVYRNQHVIYICCGFGLVMSGVNLSGVIGRLSIYCKPTCTRVFIFGDRGEEWVG